MYQSLPEATHNSGAAKPLPLLAWWAANSVYDGPGEDNTVLLGTVSTWS